VDDVTEIPLWIFFHRKITEKKQLFSLPCHHRQTWKPEGKEKAPVSQFSFLILFVAFFPLTFLVMEVNIRAEGSILSLLIIGFFV
jgi:hypothetical protein